MSDHPTPGELAGLVWNRVPSDRVKVILSHLLRGCEQCRAAVSPHLAGLFGLSAPPEQFLLPGEDAEYEAALDRSFASILEWSKDLKEELKSAALSLIADASWEEFPDIPAHLRGLPLFEALLERSWSFRHQDPKEMVRTAEWAQILAERIEPDTVDIKTLADIQCRAWIELGNAYRVADELSEADLALGRAIQFYVRGTQDELLAARLFEIQASIFSSRRSFDLARTTLDLVSAIYFRNGEQHLAGRSLIMKGILIGYNGDTEEALAALEAGVGLVNEDREPQLILAGLQNKARLLADRGHFRGARIALWNLRARRIHTGGRINELKIRWLEGQINAGLGELERAEAALQEVMLGFEGVDLPYKAALAGLELGLIILRRGDSDHAVEEVLAAVKVFQSLGIAREVSASVLLIRKAIDLKLLDVGLLQ